MGYNSTIDSNFKLPKVKNCPFCGKKPVILPTKESVDSNEEGSCWGYIKCNNKNCPAQPSVHEDIKINDDRGAVHYIANAIKRWNRRH